MMLAGLIGGTGANRRKGCAYNLINCKTKLPREKRDNWLNDSSSQLAHLFPRQLKANEQAVGFAAYCAKNCHFEPLFAAYCAGYSSFIAPNLTYGTAYCAKPARLTYLITNQKSFTSFGAQTADLDYHSDLQEPALCA
jgi:hypothetical protein